MTSHPWIVAHLAKWAAKQFDGQAQDWIGETWIELRKAALAYRPGGGAPFRPYVINRVKLKLVDAWRRGLGYRRLRGDGGVMRWIRPVFEQVEIASIPAS